MVPPALTVPAMLPGAELMWQLMSCVPNLLGSTKPRSVASSYLGSCQQVSKT